MTHEQHAGCCDDGGLDEVGALNVDFSKKSRKVRKPVYIYIHMYVCLHMYVCFPIGPLFYHITCDSQCSGSPLGLEHMEQSRYGRDLIEVVDDHEHTHIIRRPFL